MPGTIIFFVTDSDGNITTLAWGQPLTLGKYDIIVDVNGNGVYDEGIDALDDNDTEITAGIVVIPEFQSLFLFAFLAAGLTFAAVTKRWKTKRYLT